MPYIITLIIIVIITQIFILYSFAQLEYLIDALKQNPKLYHQAGSPSEHSIAFKTNPFSSDLIRFLKQHTTKPIELPMQPENYQRIRRLVLLANKSNYLVFIFIGAGLIAEYSGLK